VLNAISGIVLAFNPKIFFEFFGVLNGDYWLMAAAKALACVSLIMSCLFLADAFRRLKKI